MLGLCYVYNWKNNKRYNFTRPKMSPPGTGFSLGTMECFRIRLSGRATLWLNITESFTLKWLCELHLNKKASLPHAVYILMGKRKSIVKLKTVISFEIKHSGQSTYKIDTHGHQFVSLGYKWCKKEVTETRWRKA